MESLDRLNVSHSIGSVAATRRRKASLDDYMWMEILCHLPSAKSAFRCKCVSKLWNFLISDKYFVTRFIENHRENYGTNFDPHQLLWFLTYDSSKEKTKITSGSILFPRTSYRVESSFNDLLLCSDRKTDPLVYYIFNPFTKEQVELPMYEPIPPRSYRRVGFVCEPFYNQRCGINASYRYRVVFIEHRHDCMGDCSVVTYCSETRQWGLQTGLRIKDYRCMCDVFGHNGKLYWYTFEKVAVYDPFVTNTEPCFYFYDWKIDGPLHPTVRFQVVEGSVVLVQMGMNAVEFEVSFSKLKEKGHGDHGEWCFERRILLHNLFNSISAPSFLNQVRYIAEDSDEAYFALIFCFHPTNRDVILLSDSTSFNTASYNLGTQNWQVVGELVPFIDPGTHPSYDGGVNVAFHTTHFATTLPWWPTPLH